MIQKNSTFGKVKGVTIVEFGKGTLIFNSAIGADDEGVPHSSVLIKTSKEVMPIGGDQKTNDKTSDDFNPEIAIVFRCTKSLDAFMDKLLEARKLLVEKLKTNKDERY